MPSFIGYIKNKLVPYSYNIVIFVIILIFIILSLYAYFNIYKKERKINENKFNDVSNTSEVVDEITVLFFHVDWCPHCTSAKPKWQSFCDNNNNKIINGYKVVCNKDGIDCTDDDDVVNKYNIQSYPTIIAYKADKRYDYDASVEKQSLEKFIDYIANN
jgi:thiol-disulfide isomerase/thioredoxin